MSAPNTRSTTGSTVRLAVDVPDDGVRGGEDKVNVAGPAADGGEKRF